jgi:hypothetical protein
MLRGFVSTGFVLATITLWALLLGAFCVLVRLADPEPLVVPAVPGEGIVSWCAVAPTVSPWDERRGAFQDSDEDRRSRAPR